MNENFELTMGDMKLSWTILETKVSRTEENGGTHFHAFFELHYVEDGVLTLKDDRNSHTLSKGDLALVPPNSFHRSALITQDCHRLVFSFFMHPAADAEGAFSEYTYYNRIFHSVRRIVPIQTEAVKACARELLALQSHQTPENAHRIRLLFPLLLCRIAQALESQSTLALDRELRGMIKWTPEQEKQVFIIENCINRGYNKPDLAEEVACALHMSRRNAARVVQRLYGAAISEIVLQYRMDNARILLMNTDMKLTEIAETVGYQTYAAFFIAFKKYHGEAPEHFRSKKTDGQQQGS